MITLLQNELAGALKGNKTYTSLVEAVKKRQLPLDVEGPHGTFLSFILSFLLERVDNTRLVIVPTDQEAEEVASDLESLGLTPLRFPSWGTLIYQGISPNARTFGQRSQVLTAVLQSKPLVVASVKSLLFSLPHPEDFSSKLLRLTKGNQINLTKTSSRLGELGYLRVPRVTVPGEFALRGEVLDIFLPGEDEACRLIFDFDKIEDIKNFDPINQNSTGSLGEVLIYPAREWIWDRDSLDRMAGRMKQWIPEDAALGLAAATEDYQSFRGEELFYPLGYPRSSNFWDWMGPEAVVFIPEYDRVMDTLRTVPEEYGELYKKAKYQKLLVPPPEALLTDPGSFIAGYKNLVRFPNLRKEETQRYKLVCDSARSFLGNINFFKDEISDALQYGYKVWIFAESDTQAKRIEYLLQNPAVKVVPHGIRTGFGLPDQKILVIAENEIFGRRKKAPSSLKKAASQVIESFVDLSPGDFVVHINYGIGKFKGIDRMRVAGNERDYISLEYADSEMVFVPIEQVNLVQRYIGPEGRVPRLDVLGGKSWEKKKSQAKKSVEDLADRLVALYARRREAVGFAFPPDNEWQLSFEAAFPYQETEDQMRAIEDVKLDMESAKPMDRLICGDVGYGKTEVAMRAAFKAVTGGKQVAFLAPTTILAEQHYENFAERFKRFPVRMGMLSRFVEPKVQKQVLAQLEAGELDLVIGTHRIIQKDVKFKNLGLMIIDEEQRFGVKDKERMKEIKNSIDSLAMSATPIPRTLHMSLLKIRDMSVLRTAPRNRQPIETFISEFNDQTITGAIRREVERGGQIFFLHNRVESLENVQLFLQNLVPELLVETAHGQMDPKDLEDVMHRFIHGAFHVLVSTTIIENGIDIPNVNTIIIDRADMYGISQLYQLRGRVGRSGKLAYAYLFYPKERALTELAMRRLQIISDFTELGSGFKIAMKDLEVRGAGNLLGAEQSGDIMAVGFDMYLRLLDEAVASRQGVERDQQEEIYLELEYSGFIPDSYITDPAEKMEVYKKISSVVDDDDLDRVYREIGDRFGPLPEEVLSLLSLAEIRILCRKLKVISLRERAGLCTVEFGLMKDFPFDKAMRMIKLSSGKVRPAANKPNALVLETKAVGLKDKSLFIREKLSALI